MDKQNAKILFEILKEKVPNREVCRVASQQEIERIMAEVNVIIEEKKIEEEENFEGLEDEDEFEDEFDDLD